MAAIGRAENTLKRVMHKLPKLSHYTTELGNRTYGLMKQDHNLVNNQLNHFKLCNHFNTFTTNLTTLINAFLIQSNPRFHH